MSIVGGLDIHRKQLTFDYLDTVTGQVVRGQVAPADRERLRAWLARFAGRDDVAFAFEGCTGWRYVAGELAAAGTGVHMAEPADTALARGRKRRAKTDKTDSAHLRRLLAEGRMARVPGPAGAGPGSAGAAGGPTTTCAASTPPGCSASTRPSSTRARPPSQRAPCAAPTGRPRRARPPGAAPAPAGQRQVAVALALTACLEGQLEALRHELLDMARHMKGARALAAQIYGVGPLTALALTCWLGGAGRFSSARKAVRFAGLDITVYSSDGKRTPGRLSRQGPPALRWAVYEACKAHARASAPDHAYYAQVKDRKNGKRAALSEARKIIRLGLPHPERPRRRRLRRRLNRPVNAAAARRAQARITAMLTRWGTTAASSLRIAVSRPRPARGRADGLIRLSGRLPPRGTPNPSSCRRGRERAPPQAKVRLADPAPAPAATAARTPSRGGRQPGPHNRIPHLRGLPAPTPPAMIWQLPGGRVKGHLRWPLRGRCAPLDPAARSQNPAAIRDRGQNQGCPGTPACGAQPMQVRR